MPDLLNILRQSYDNAKVTIDLQRTHNLQQHPRKYYNQTTIIPMTTSTRPEAVGRVRHRRPDLQNSLRSS